jgi:integrase
MPRKKAPHGHTGRTDAGHTRDVKVERVGKVTVYKRGAVYYLYYRQAGASQRRKVDGNLAVARATAAKVLAALDQGRPSPVAYTRTSPEKMVEAFLDAVANVKKLALRTRDRYHAALDRFLDYCRSARVGTVDAVQQATVEDFVKWLRGQKRTRNGSAHGRKDVYKEGGIKFILSTCRTAFNWAGRHRMLPFAECPFALFPIDELGGARGQTRGPKLFSAEQERAFFAACSDWQRDIFATLAGYGLRVGELTHLLVEDVDLVNAVFTVRSKPELFWSVKTGRERQLPLLPETRAVFERAIGGRQAGFVFLNEPFTTGRSRPALSFGSDQGFRAHAEKITGDLLAQDADAGERAQKRAVVSFCRSMGQVPEKRVRCEFMKVSAKIGRPDLTQVHILRHQFATRAQAAGVNPLVVQEMLGHTTLDMTRRYSHPGIDTMREALQRLATAQGRADCQATSGGPHPGP